MTKTIANGAVYTIRSANRTLPLIQRIVDDIVILSKRVRETRDRLNYLTEGRPVGEEDVYSKELKAIEESTESDSQLLDGFLRELLSLNTIPTNAHQGFVDFLAIREGEKVCLCWRRGETEVTHWHRMNEDCSERRPIDLPLIRQSGERTTSGSV